MRQQLNNNYFILIIMGEVKTYNLRNILVKTIGFLLGFFFGYEIFSWIGVAVGWMKEGALPTVYGLFGEMGGVIGLVLAGLAILITIAMIKRWKLLVMLEFIVVGFLCGLVIPFVWPIISDKLASFNLPF